MNFKPTPWEHRCVWREICVDGDVDPRVGVTCLTYCVQGCLGATRSGNDAIAGRGDLTSVCAACIPALLRQDVGALDAKYTTYTMMNSYDTVLASQAISSPTYDNQPTFAWSNFSIPFVRHYGMPDLYRFPWMPVTWNFTQV